jgi:hypothetical protein
MNEFAIVIDRKCTVWERTTYYVKARTLASALRRIDGGDGYDAKGVSEGDTDTLYDTMEGTGDIEVMESECEKV